MNSGSNGQAGVVSDVASQLGGIFRHMLPGVMVMIAAFLCRPGWFRSNIPLATWPQVLVLAVTTVGVGNVWFALNRYGFHQLVDFALWCFKVESPARHGQLSSYIQELAVYSARSLHTGEADARARQHVSFRASTVLLIYTVGELALLFAVMRDKNSLFQSISQAVVVSFGLGALVVGVWQLWLTRRIDGLVVK